MSLEASRKTQKALALEISIDKLRLVLQQHGISDADCSLNDSRLSTGDGGGRVSLEGDHSSAASRLASLAAIRLGLARHPTQTAQCGCAGRVKGAKHADG